MTNREYLNQKNSAELVTWLDTEYADFTPAITTVAGDWSLTPNFKPAEFVCKCGKCSFSKPEGVMNMDFTLRLLLQAIRNQFGPTTVTCGARCQTYNDSLKGSVKNSYHIKLKAADLNIPGVTNTVSGREKVLAFAKKQPNFKYGYHNVNGNAPNMGSAIHIEVY